MEERITVTRSQHKGLNGILNLFFQRDERNVNDVYADDSYDLLIFLWRSLWLLLKIFTFWFSCRHTVSLACGSSTSTQNCSYPELKRYSRLLDPMHSLVFGKSWGRP